MAATILTFFLAVCVTPSVIGDTLPVVVNTWPFVDANEAGEKKGLVDTSSLVMCKWVWPFQRWGRG